MDLRCKFALIVVSLLITPCLARPPKVIQMIPESGAADVKPGLQKVRILFDQDMNTEGMSICGSGDNFPKIIGEPRWTSKRAFLMNVRLKPNHDYSFGVNCPSAQNFKSARGEPAEILFVNFRTAGENGLQKESATDEKSPTWKCLSLLDLHTQARLSEFENFFSSCYQYPQEYTNASESQKTMLEKRWIRELNGNNQDIMAAAATYLGMIQSESAVEPLEKILANPPRNGRLKWTCTRSLGQIKQKSSIPILIGLLDDINANTRVYARVSLAEITGVYFEKDKEKWTAWHKDPSSVAYIKNESNALAGSHQAAIDKLREAIDSNYSYKDEKNINWDILFEKYSKPLSNAASAKEFAEYAGTMLAYAKDKHIWLEVNGEHVSAYRNPITPNANLKLLPKLIPNYIKHNATISTGQFPGGIGYIYIDSWSRQQKQDFEQLYGALKKFSDAQGLIIDIRGNGGGSETIAQEFAGCFINEPKPYAKHVYRDMNSPDGFSKTQERLFYPNKERPQYRGKVAVLVGPVVMSSGEGFTLMMKQVPGCKIIGEPTQGSSGNPKPYDLGNGVTVYLPSWKAMLPDGSCFEGKGIRPDILVKARPEQITTKDPVIEAALKELRKP